MKWIAFCCGTLLIMAIAGFQIINLNGHYDHTHRWSLDFAQYKREIFSKRTSPSLILVGGSSSLYAIDTAKLAKQIQMPVLNYALGANIGLELILEESLSTLRPGDTAVLILEPELLATPPHASQSYVYNHIINHRLFERRSWWQSVSILAHAPLSILTGGSMQSRSDRFKNIYTSASLNDYGDFKESVLLDNPPAHRLSVTNLMTYRAIHPDNSKVLQTFVDACKEKGIDVMALHAPMIETPHRSFKRFVKDLEDLYIETGVTFFHTSEPLVYHARLAFDTYEHFNPSIRPKHTALLAQAIVSGE